MSAELETARPRRRSQGIQHPAGHRLVFGGHGRRRLGIFLGRELRSRYKFKRRTPYDFYSNAGEQPGDYGVGV